MKRVEGKVESVLRGILSFTNELTFSLYFTMLDVDEA